MASFTITAVPGGTGSGTHTISVYNISPNPVHGTPSTRTIDGRTFYTVQNVRYTTAPYSGTSQGYDSDEIPAGWYYLSEDHVGANEVQIYVRADSGGTGFGGLKVAQTNIGSQASVGSHEIMYGLGVIDDLYFMWYTTATAWEQNRVYPLGFGFKFDGIDDYVNPDTPDPYKPPSGQAGNDSAAGGGGNGGAGYPTGTNTSTPENKKNRAGVGCNIYLCSATAVKAFTKMLWGSTNTGFIDAFFKRVQNAVYNPIDSIITCHSLPSAFAPQGTVGTEGIKAGGVDFSTYDENCVGAPISNEWVHAGPFSYVCDETWGNYSDYKNTTAHLYLPFCGIVPLDTSLFFGYNGDSHLAIKVDYWCNLLNGNCAAYVTTIDREGDTKLIKVATGNCAQPCPLSGNDRGMQQKLGALFGFAQSLPSAITSGSALGILAGVASPAIGAIGQDITASRHTNVVGSLNGAAGFAAATDIQIVFDIPIPMESENYSMCRGRPSEVSRSVGDYTGHCELEIHADSVNYATDEEKREIEKICLTGILI